MQPENLTALNHYIATLRQTLELSANLNADTETLNAAAQQLQQLNQQLQPHTEQKPLPQFNINYGDRLSSILPYSPISGALNPIAPPLDVMRGEEDSTRLTATLTLGRIYEGPPELVHGSVVAAIYDQIMAFSAVDQKVAGFTANLSVDYLAGTPLFAPLTFTSWVDSVNGKKVIVKAECHSSGTLLTRCTGLFIAFQPES
ncbi:PaaI family thioesterase [Litorivivens sp.]|uniref:PaaI family thioesterase n=1 Tax=Litorivivens sp. TaxID=2020868 RepID=UPI0035638B29